MLRVTARGQLHPLHRLTSSFDGHATVSAPARLEPWPPSLSWIFVAPVKGFAVVARDEVELGPNGIDDDRRFHLIGAEGRLLNGKQLAPLVQIVPEWVEDSGFLSLSFPTGEVVSGVIELGESVTTNFYGRRDVEGRVVEARGPRRSRRS